MNNPNEVCLMHRGWVTGWTNPSHEARNERATSRPVWPAMRLRLRFSQHHKSCNDND